MLREALLAALVLASALDAAEDLQADGKLLERHLAGKIHLGTIYDGTDVALSADGARAWVCTRGAMIVLDTVTGRLVGSFGELTAPSAIHYNQATQHLYVVDEEPRSGSRGALVRVFDPGTEKQLRTIPVADWRLYRIADAKFSADGRWLWLTSGGTGSSLYGWIPPALFRVDLKAGAWTRLAGAPLDKPTASKLGGPPRRGGPTDAPPYGLALEADAAGRLFVTGLEPKTLSIFPPGAKAPGKKVPLPVDARRLHLCHSGVLLVAAERMLSLVDTKEHRVLKTLPLKGPVRAICSDADGARAFLSVEDSGRILVLRARSGKFESPIAYRHPPEALGRIPPPRAFRCLVGADNPPRLVGISLDGYRLATCDLRTNILRTVHVTGFYRAVVGPTREVAYLCCERSGNIVVVDLKAGRFTGTIEVGARRIGMVLFPDRKRALVVDCQAKSLAIVDLVRRVVTGRIALGKQPDPFAVFSADHNQVCVPLAGREHPWRHAVVTLKPLSIQEHRFTKLPRHWERLFHTRKHNVETVCYRKHAYGPKTGAGAEVLAHREGTPPTTLMRLRLRDGSHATVPLYGGAGAPVIVGPNEQYVYVFGHSSLYAFLYKLRL